MNEEKLVSMFGILIDKMEGFEEGQKKLEERLDERLGRLEEGQKRLEEKVDRLEADVAEIKNHIIIMEEENKKRFTALFDGYKLLYEKSGDLSARLDKLEAVQQTHTLRLVFLETEKKISWQS